MSAVNCFQPKIIFLLKWSVLGWHSLVPFSVKSRKPRGLLGGLTPSRILGMLCFPFGEIGEQVNHIAGEVHACSWGPLANGSSLPNQRPTEAQVGNPIATGSEAGLAEDLPMTDDRA